MKLRLFRLFTGIAGAYHLVLGLVGWLLPIATFADLSEVLLGIRPEGDGQFQMTAKFASAYVLSFGLVLMILCKHPQKYRVLAIPVLTLFGIRLINKLIFFGSISESFGVSMGRNVFAVACVAVFFFGILLTLPKARD